MKKKPREKYEAGLDRCDYVVQKLVDGDLQNRWLAVNSETWTTFKACAARPTKEDAIATLETLSLVNGVTCRIRAVRGRALAIGTKKSKHRTR